MKHGRLEWLRPEDLDENQRAYYDALLDGPRDRSALVDNEGRLSGPFNARLLAPSIGTAIQQQGAALRFGPELSSREREIVILEVARSERCNYEWIAHARVARAAGMSEEALSAILTGTDAPAEFADDELSARRLAQHIIANRDLDDEAFAQAVESVGLQKLFVIISLIGHYQHTAMSLRIWRVPLDADMTPVFTSTDSGDA